MSESLIAFKLLLLRTSPSKTTGSLLLLILRLPLSSSRNDLYKSIRYFGAEFSLPMESHSREKFFNNQIN